MVSCQLAQLERRLVGLEAACWSGMTLVGDGRRRLLKDGTRRRLACFKRCATPLRARSQRSALVPLRMLPDRCAPQGEPQRQATGARLTLPGSTLSTIQLLPLSTPPAPYPHSVTDTQRTHTHTRTRAHRRARTQCHTHGMAHAACTASPPRVAALLLLPLQRCPHVRQGGGQAAPQVKHLRNNKQQQSGFGHAGQDSSQSVR